MAKQLTPDEIEEYSGTVFKFIGMLTGDRKALVEDMMEGWVGEQYFEAPASSREEHHSCYPGGLMVHSLNVVKNLNRLAKSLCPGKYSDEALVFLGLFHDLGKVGDGKEPYYVPNPSDWHREKGMLYEINKDCTYMPTAERSLFLLQKYGIQLTPDEFVAIRIHDGQYEDGNKPYRMREPELALLLHWADMWSVKQEKSGI